MKEPWTTTAAGIVVLLTASALSGWIQFRGDPDPVTAEMLQTSEVQQRAEEEGIAWIDTREAEERLNAGTHLFLDARAESDYMREHLPAALSLPVTAFEEHFPALAPILDADTPLVIYCSGPDCDEGLLLIQRLRDAGYQDLTLYLDGLEGWRRAGL